MTIGLIAHVEKPGAPAALALAVAALRSRNARFLAETKTAHLVGGIEDGGDTATLAKKCDLFLVLGGDGTILRVLHHLEETIPPIFGVNIGSLGFLTCLGPEETDAAVASILAGNFLLSHRKLLLATLFKENGETSRFEALNDVVVSRGEHSQLVKVRVFTDGVPLTDYHADGLIVATPTGSTAYSLSAGGPILVPESRSLVITPICPHVLTNRSVVLGDHSTIEMEPADSTRKLFLTVDGNLCAEIAGNSRLEIRSSQRSLPLAMLPGRSFSEILRQKLKWSGSNI